MEFCTFVFVRTKTKATKEENRRLYLENYSEVATSPFHVFSLMSERTQYLQDRMLDCLFYLFISFIPFICLWVSCFKVPLFISFFSWQPETMQSVSSLHFLQYCLTKIRCCMIKNLMLHVFSTHATWKKNSCYMKKKVMLHQIFFHRAWSGCCWRDWQLLPKRL